MILNLQHDRARPLARTGGGGLDITDGTDRLTVRAMLPDTTDGRMTQGRLLRHDGQGVLRGFSVEMKVEADEIDPGTRLRTIHRAKLHGLGLVDRPAYEQVEAAILKRFQDMESRASFDGYYEYDGVETIGDTGADRKRQVSPGAFRGSIDDQAQEITLSVGRNPQEAIASKLAGTLILRDTATRLEIEAPTPAATDALRNLQAKRAAGMQIYVEPLFRDLDGGFEDVPEPGNTGVNIRRYSAAKLYGLALNVRQPKGADSGGDIRAKSWALLNGSRLYSG